MDTEDNKHVAAAPVAQAAMPKPWQDRMQELADARADGRNYNGDQITARDAEIADLRAALQQRQAPAPTFWNSRRKMIERAIIGLRDGWATRKDADDALSALAPQETDK